MPSPHPTNQTSPAHDAPRRAASPTGDRNDERRAALAAFYSTHAHALTAAVRGRVKRVDADLIADACAYAWLQLVRRPDITLDLRGTGWLNTVATHEARRLAGPSPERRVGGFLADPEDGDEMPDPVSPDGDPLARVLNLETQRERVERFARLKPRERRDLLLLAAGYSYAEIAELTASTYTAVNRRITEGRRRLRDH